MKTEQLVKQIAEAVLDECAPWKFIRHGLENLTDQEREEFEGDLHRAIASGLGRAVEHDFQLDFLPLAMPAQQESSEVGQPKPIQLSMDLKAVSRHSSAALGNEAADDEFDPIPEFRGAVGDGKIQISPAQHETLERLVRNGFVVEIDPAGRLTFLSQEAP